SDHALDLDMIQAIITFGSDVQTKHAKIIEFACWLHRTGQKSIALALCDQNDLEKAQPSDALVKKIKATQRKYQYPVDKSMESALVEHMQRRLEMQERLMPESMAKRPINQPTQHADDMEMVDQPQRLESHRRLVIEPKAKSPTYQPSQRADDTELEDADPSSSGQDLGSTKGRSTVHDPMPGGLRRSSVKAAAFHGRVTPLGMQTQKYWLPKKRAAIMLMKGDTLIMPPGVLVIHAPYTPTDCLLAGGMFWDFYARTQLAPNLAYIKKHNDWITNDDPPGETVWNIIMRRMQECCEAWEHRETAIRSAEQGERNGLMS
ncbi:hypothetical protein B0A54_17069, partial [Friedmanniomyces endolithicus]